VYRVGVVSAETVPILAVGCVPRQSICAAGCGVWRREAGAGTVQEGSRGCRGAAVYSFGVMSAETFPILAVGCVLRQRIPLQVAAVSGDVRRALELCRKAAEIAEAQQHASSAPAASSGERTVSHMADFTGRLYGQKFAILFPQLHELALADLPASSSSQQVYHPSLHLCLFCWCQRPAP